MSTQPPTCTFSGQCRGKECGRCRVAICYPNGEQKLFQPLPPDDSKNMLHFLSCAIKNTFKKKAELSITPCDGSYLQQKTCRA